MKKNIFIIFALFIATSCVAQISLSTIQNGLKIKIIKAASTNSDFKVVVYNGLDSSAVLFSKFDYMDESSATPENTYIRLYIINKATKTKKELCFPIDVYPSDRKYLIQSKSTRMFRANEDFVSELNKINLTENDILLTAHLQLWFRGQVFDALNNSFPVEIVME